MDDLLLLLVLWEQQDHHLCAIKSRQSEKGNPFRGIVFGQMNLDWALICYCLLSQLSMLRLIMTYDQVWGLPEIISSHELHSMALLH